MHVKDITAGIADSNSPLSTLQNWRNQEQEMKNPEGQLPRYVEDRQAFDNDSSYRKGQIHDGWRIGQIAKMTDKETTKRVKI